MPNHPTPQHACGSCSHWTRHGDERMAQHGGCNKQPVGYYTHESSACVLVPSAWSARK